ncbi:hypothetical protein ABET41_03710 [Metabacillus fastidiosus]|uniref:Uncharacterized protein n=1 Tax=Metabacillus fastidiosus TaxID=1458 RepID=A0ABU6P419_9BACI|nr:hypothetical protein [Metabacillus fastidiosus]MED4403783.1 hypothetical protein [Metabacillus fastidiosus]MED4463507.1 hypothetical protein [Metabacillus fastidiosus]
MKKIITLLFILTIIVFVSYFESSEKEYVTSFPAFSSEGSTVTTAVESDKEKLSLPVLEKKLVGSTYIDGYEVEVYREYEVYKDEDGEIIESIPTSNYNYLRYKE